MSKRLTLEEFITKAEAKYGKNKYDFSESKYINNYTKIKIKCLSCGSYFWKIPSSFLNGNECSCQKLYKKIPKLNKDIFIKRAEEIYGKNRYGYDDVIYINNYTLVKIYCPECNEYFYKEPRMFLSGFGCPSCSRREKSLKQQMPQDIWIHRAEEKFGDICDYSETIYRGDDYPVRIFCKEHQGYFEQRPSTHYFSSYGCPICAFKKSSTESKGEEYIRLSLDELNIKYDKEYPIIDKIDGRTRKYVRIDYRLIYDGKEYWIEYNGIQHYKYIPFFDHGDTKLFSKQIKRDQNVCEYCKNNGIILIEIPYTYDTYNSVLNILSDILINHKSPEEIITYPEIIPLDNKT